MAVKKRPAGQAESKPAMIITLVFFVLLSIGALVWGYFGYDGQEALRAKAEDAKKEVEAHKKEEQWQKLQALFYKVNAGLAKANDQQDYTLLRDQYSKSPQSLVGAGAQAEAEKAEFELQLAALEQDPPKGLGKDPIKTSTTYINQIAKLTQDKDVLVKARLNDQLAVEAAKQAQEDANKALDAARKTFAKDLADAKQELAKEKNSKSEEFKNLVAMNEQLQTQLAAAKQAADKREKELKDQFAALTQLKNDQDIKIKKLEDKVASNGVKLGDLDLPKGKIIQVDPTGNMVSINLGSFDRVKEGLTFSISGANAGTKSGGKPKATIEVVRVIDAHLSRAAVTDVVDRSRDPILNGDLLYNLAWNPNFRERVAIAGLIDLHNDGRDSTPEFIAQLQKQNIDVDAYLDLKDLQIKGRGMSLQTSYLILGPTPEFDTNGQIKENDARADRKKEILAKMSELRVEADRLGIEAISARRFMARIGYRLPKSSQGEVQANYDTKGFSTSGGSSPPNPNGK